MIVGVERLPSVTRGEGSLKRRRVAQASSALQSIEAIIT